MLEELVHDRETQSNILPAKTSKLYRLKKTLYHKSFYAFFKDAFKVLEPSNELVDNWHIKYFCDYLQAQANRVALRQPRQHHLCLNVAPRTSKTLLFSIAFNAWVWTNWPRLKFLCFSYSKDRANENAKALRDLIESEWYQHYFQNFKLNKNAIENIATNKHGYRHSYGLSGFTGDGGDFIIIDDPQDPHMAESVQWRQRVIQFYRAVASRLNNAKVGQIIIVQQRLHREDLTGFLKQNAIQDSYKFISLPAKLNNETTAEFVEYYRNEFFDAIRLDDDVLKLKASGSELGARAFQAQFMQKPVDTDNGIFKSDWLQTISHVEFLQLTRDKFHKFDFFIDTAYGGVHADNNAILIACYFNNNLYIKKVVINKMQFPELQREVLRLQQLYGSAQSMVYVEPTAAGRPLVQSMKNLGLNIIEGKAPNRSKLERAVAITPYLEAGRVFLITEDLQNEWVDKFIGELITFDGQPGNVDDQVDTLTMACDKYMLNVKQTSFYMPV